MKKMILGLLVVLALVSMVIAAQVTSRNTSVSPVGVSRVPASVTPPFPTQTTAQPTYKYSYKTGNGDAAFNLDTGWVSAISNFTTGGPISVLATAGFLTDKITASTGKSLTLSMNVTINNKAGAPGIILELFKVSTTAGVSDTLIESSMWPPQLATNKPYQFKTANPLATAGTYYARARFKTLAYSGHSTERIDGNINSITIVPNP